MATLQQKAELYDELEAALYDVMKHLKESLERIAELEKINASQIQQIANLASSETVLTASESEILYKTAVQNRIKSLEAQLENKQYEIEALRTNLPTPPVTPQEFIQMKAALEEESMMRGIAEKQNQVLIQQAVTLKQENEMLKRESGIAEGAELEAMKNREKSKDLELEALRREIEVCREEKKINGETIKSLLHKRSKPDSESSWEQGPSSSFGYH